MTLPELKIGDLTLRVPIVQGGMGVGVSKASLASAVSAEGGLGVIASVGLAGGARAKAVYESTSRTALLEEIRLVKAKGLPVGVNVMVALSNYADLVRTCVEGGADAIFSGAGLPLRLPEATGDSPIKLIPIVSSARAAALICRTWEKKYDRLPDAIVVEGPMAGGHLGFKYDDLAAGTAPLLEDLVREVVPVADEYGQKKGCHIPVIAAGGVYTSEDIVRMLDAGAGAVQMGTRFVGTYECDASDAYKQSYIDAKQEDVILIKSPVGLPARVVRNEFVLNNQNGHKQRFACPYRCLLSCNAATANYCIAEALVSSEHGDMANGFAMCGQNAYRVNKLVSVKELMHELCSVSAAPVPA